MPNWKDAGKRRAGHDRVDRRPARKQHLTARVQIGRDHVDQDGRLLERVEPDVLAEQAAQRRGAAQVVPLAEEAEEPFQRIEGEDGLPLQRTPHAGQLVEVRTVETLREHRGIDGTGRCPDQDVGPDVALEKRASHAHLDRAQTRAPRKHKRGRHRCPLRRSMIVA